MKRKDLGRALRFLKSIETRTDNPIEPVNGSESTRSGIAEVGLYGVFERDWEVLDTCLNADNMKLVGSAYAFLKDRGFLPSFGKFRNIGNHNVLFEFSCFFTLFKKEDNFNIILCF